jgi:hypothetical protein
MSLLTLVQVQDWVPQAAGEESLIADAIEMAEALADAYCDRGLAAGARTETYDIGDGQGVVALRNYPIDTTATFTVKTGADTDTPTTLTSSDYELDATHGLLLAADGGTFPAGARSLEVTYTAGYTSATLPAGLRRALLQLVAWVLESRGNVGTRQESVDGHQWTSEDMDGVVPTSVGAALRPWKAVRIG